MTLASFSLKLGLTVLLSSFLIEPAYAQTPSQPPETTSPSATPSPNLTCPSEVWINYPQCQCHGPSGPKTPCTCYSNHISVQPSKWEDVFWICGLSEKPAPQDCRSDSDSTVFCEFGQMSSVPLLFDSSSGHTSPVTVVPPPSWARTQSTGNTRPTTSQQTLPINNESIGNNRPPTSEQQTIRTNIPPANDEMTSPVPTSTRLESQSAPSPDSILTTSQPLLFTTGTQTLTCPTECATTVTATGLPGMIGKTGGTAAGYGNSWKVVVGLMSWWMASWVARRVGF